MWKITALPGCWGVTLQLYWSHSTNLSHLISGGLLGEYWVGQFLGGGLVFPFALSTPPFIRRRVRHIEGRLKPFRAECEWTFKPSNTKSASVQAYQHQNRKCNRRMCVRKQHTNWVPSLLLCIKSICDLTFPLPLWLSISNFLKFKKVVYYISVCVMLLWFNLSRVFHAGRNDHNNLSVVMVTATSWFQYRQSFYILHSSLEEPSSAVRGSSFGVKLGREVVVGRGRFRIRSMSPCGAIGSRCKKLWRHQSSRKSLGKRFRFFTFWKAQLFFFYLVPHWDD